MDGAALVRLYSHVDKSGQCEKEAGVQLEMEGQREAWTLLLSASKNRICLPQRKETDLTLCPLLSLSLRVPSLSYPSHTLLL